MPNILLAPSGVAEPLIIHNISQITFSLLLSLKCLESLVMSSIENEA